MRRGLHHNEKLQRAWAKYGGDAFSFRPLLICAPDDLLFYEQRALDAYNAVEAGYNICSVAGTVRGFKRKPFSAEHRAKLREGHARSPRTGQKRTQEQRERIRAAIRASFARGERAPVPPRTAETFKKIALRNTGRSASVEHRAKNSAAKKAWASTPEGIAKLRAMGARSANLRRKA